MIRKHKRGLSPVVATVLLVSLAIILAIIIFLWARGFVSEKIQKFDQPIEDSCGKVLFEAEAIAADGKIYIGNKANVAIYGISVREKSAGSVIDLGIGTFNKQTLVAGDTNSVEFDELDKGDEIGASDDLIIVPIILGETKSHKQSHICDESYGEPIKVV